ncbi:MAG: hypothetical protein E7662_00095 [Ruminococcaceae bacterium]|nr:hypothetical protein [Oscillospiraceae bacterium]
MNCKPKAGCHAAQNPLDAFADQSKTKTDSSRRRQSQTLRKHGQPGPTYSKSGEKMTNVPADFCRGSASCGEFKNCR